MTGLAGYRWPTKIKKFGIEDPFQKLVVAKYEGEIPWQSVVRDQDTLGTYIQEKMLPDLMAKVSYPPAQGTKHHFTSAKNVDLGMALTTDPELNQEDKEIIRSMWDEDGESKAKEVLLKQVNERKAKAFRAWIDWLGKDYAAQPAFQLLLMRPLFAMTNSSTRRTVMPVSRDVIDWMYRRISSGRLTPNDNIARMYSWKLAAGSQRVPLNGWQYIPAGRENASQLTAASRGSGWCVASGEYAEYYLRDSCFYILRSEGKPVVALRGVGRYMEECQGRYNDSPGGWFSEIALFLKTQDYHLHHRYLEMGDEIGSEESLSNKPISWWQRRIIYWPFAYLAAPDEMRQHLGKISTDSIVSYTGFPSYQALSAKIGLEFGLEEWKEMVLIDPFRFTGCPIEFKESEGLKNACLKGWIERVEDNEITLKEIENVPDFVKSNEQYTKALMTDFPDAFLEGVRNPPKSARERLSPFKLGDYIPESTDEPYKLAVERSLNTLLNNQDDNFTDDIFSLELRQRDDFPAVRVQAWYEALQAHPPMWFALPDDLADEEKFAVDTSENIRVDIHGWAYKVTESPWLLTQKNGVPKSIRLHREILDAYKQGWILYLDVPWRIWLKRGRYRRVYMSYALLANKDLVAALTKRWEAHSRRAKWAWDQGSERMKDMLVMQVAFLRGNCNRQSIRGEETSLLVCVDISKRYTRQAKRHPSNPHIQEIATRLRRAGIYF